MAAKVGSILITSYVYGPTDALQGTQQVGISTDDAIFTEVGSDDPKADDGVNAKVTYRNDVNTVYWTSETAAQLVAQANGTLSAS